MAGTRTIAVVTGTRAEFGLLRPVMRAIESNPNLSLQVIAAGAHLLPPANTIDDVADEFDITATVPMQSAENEASNARPRRAASTFSHSQERENVATMQPPAITGRTADAVALGRGITGFAECFSEIGPGIVLVLGDRVEVFAAAAAAAVAGIRVAHMHGGDRAEGIADESMRHAITKLAHIHLPATLVSAQRIIAMGEQPARVHVVGSPAIDGLSEFPPLSDPEFRALGSPRIVVLLHPMGRADDIEQRFASELICAAKEHGPALIFHPNHDPGRDGIINAIESSGCAHRSHLPRPAFIGLLKRIDLLVGNSSAGLIECSALGVRVINVGNRQRGRERANNVTDVTESSIESLRSTIKSALDSPRLKPNHTFGDGLTGPRTAELLATFDLDSHAISKCNSY